MTAEAAKLAVIRAILAAFDWESDDRQLALEAIDRVVSDDVTAPCSDCGGRGCAPDMTACTSCLGTGELPVTALPDREMFGEAWMAQAESGSASTGAWVESAGEAYATAQAEGLAAADLDEDA